MTLTLSWSVFTTYLLITYFSISLLLLTLLSYLLIVIYFKEKKYLFTFVLLIGILNMGFQSYLVKYAYKYNALEKNKTYNVLVEDIRKKGESKFDIIGKINNKNTLIEYKLKDNKIKNYKKSSIEYQSAKNGNLSNINNIIDINKEKLNVYYENFNNLIGREITIKGNLEIPKKELLPKTFNYKRFLLSKNIIYIIKINRIEKINPTHHNNFYSYYLEFKKILYNLRDNFLNNLTVTKKCQGFLTGILFGNTSFIDKANLKEFRLNGTAHILAISGLHIGILFGIYSFLSKYLNKKIFELFFCIFLICYGIITMFSPSVLRAIFIILLKLFADKENLPFDLLTSTSLIAFSSILKNPYIIFYMGFQLSFLAILSIIFFMPLLNQKLPKFLGINLAVFLGLLPYNILIFNHISIISLLANFPIIFLASIIVPIGILAFFIFLIFNINLGFFALILESLSTFIIKLNKFFYFNGLFTFEIPSPNIGIILFLYITLFFFLSEEFLLTKNLKIKDNKKKMFTLFLIILIIPMTTNYFNKKIPDGINIYNFNNAPMIHLKDNNKNLIINCSSNKDFNMVEKTLKPYFLKSNISKVNYALSTSFSKEDYLGIFQLSKSFKIDIIYYSYQNKYLLKDNNYQIKLLWKSKEKIGEKNMEKRILGIKYRNKFLIVMPNLNRKELKKYLPSIIKNIYSYVKYNNYNENTSNYYIIGNSFALTEIKKSIHGIQITLLPLEEFYGENRVNY